MLDNLILRLLARLLLPFLCFFAFYVLLHGKYSPGGGFQAGVVFATALILYALVFGVRALEARFPIRLLQAGAALGVLIYGGVGVVAALKGGLFLEYSALTVDPLSGQFWGILLVETGIGLTVASVMLALFQRFAVWRPDPELKSQSRTEEVES